jgi:hypothetical protein
MTEIEEIFRNPNILIESIKEMQQKQQETMKEIQSKLNSNDQNKRQFGGNQMNSNQIHHF